MSKKVTETKSKAKQSKLISIDINTYNAICNIKNEMAKKFGSRITFGMVVQSLLNDRADLINTKKELEEIKKETEETQNYIKNMLQLALSNKTTIVQSSADIPHVLNPPPPPRVPTISKEDMEKKMKIIQQMEDEKNKIKDIFVKELNVIFDGVQRKPSEIMEITRPKHKDAKIEEIDEEKAKSKLDESKSYVYAHADKFTSEETK